MTIIFTVTKDHIPAEWRDDPARRAEFLAAFRRAFPNAKRTLRGNYNLIGDDPEQAYTRWLAAFTPDSNPERETP